MRQWLLLLLTTCGLTAALGAEALSPLAGGATVHGPGVQPQKCEFADGKIHIEWEPTDSNHIAVGFAKPVEVPAFGSLHVVARFMAEEETPAHHFGLRLMDATGETFQYSAPVRQHPSGRVDCRWDVGAATRAGVWGGNGDKKFDFPMKVVGFSVDYRQDAPRTFLDLLKFEVVADDAPMAAPAPAGARRVNLAAGVRKFLPGVEGNVKIDWNGKAVAVPLDTAAAKYAELVFAEALPVEKFAKLKVSARLAANDDCPVRSVGLRLLDAKNETFQFPRPVDFAAAMGSEAVVTWEVAAGEWKQSWGGDGNHQIDMPVKVYAFGVDYAQGKVKDTVLEIREVKVEVE